MISRNLLHAQRQYVPTKTVLAILFSASCLFAGQPAQAQLSLRNQRLSSEGSFLKTKGLPTAPGKSIKPVLNNLFGWPWWWPLVLPSRPIPPRPTTQATPYSPTVSTREDTPKSISLKYDATRYEIVTSPEHGTVSESGSAWIYTPHANFHGKDSFTFRLKATSTLPASNVATATITVRSVADPVVAYPDSYIASGPLYVPVEEGVLQNDLNIDGRPLTARIERRPAFGTLVLNQDGSFSYDPAGSLSGSVSFTYKVLDRSVASNSTTVTIDLAPISY